MRLRPRPTRWAVALSCALLLLGVLAASAPAQEPVIPQGGLAVVEAEDVDAKVPRSARDGLPIGDGNTCTPASTAPSSNRTSSAAIGACR